MQQMKLHLDRVIGAGRGTESKGVGWSGLTLGSSVVWGDGWVGGASSVRGPGKLTLQVE